MRISGATSGLKRTISLTIASGLLIAGLGGATDASAIPTAGLPGRSADPVVLTGAQTPNLIGVAPGNVVAFRYDDKWTQIPVQVDERKWADYRIIRRVGLGSQQFGHEVYADPNTFTEADGVPQRDWQGANAIIPGTTGDPMVDTDDEIAMMASDSGGSAFQDTTGPAGVDNATRTVVKITDPLDPTSLSYIYLFKTTSGLDPSAGKDYVSYNWNFSPALSPAYKTSNSFTSGYNFNSIGDNVGGPPVNPEASSVTTDDYEQTFPARWMVDGMKIKMGGATGVDILDGDKSTVGSSSCGRNELTFSRGAGGFIANIDGPVRAIRSFVGANSGTYTQRDQIYYRDQVNTETYLRVHAGITDFILAKDFNANAFGMTYRNNLNTAGVTIDGNPDSVTLGQLGWEQATGAQGTLTDVNRIDTDIPLRPLTSFYADTATPGSAGAASIACSGDSSAIGASGPRVQMITDPPTPGGRNTDPTLAPTPPSTQVNMFTAHRHMFFNAPNEPVATSELRSRQVDSPLSEQIGAGVDVVDVKGPTPKSPVKLTVGKVKRAVKPGKRIKVRVGVRNFSSGTVTGVKICPAANRKRVKTFGCKKISSILSESTPVRFFPVVVKKGRGHKPVTVRFNYSLNDAAGTWHGSGGVRIRVLRK